MAPNIFSQFKAKEGIVTKDMNVLSKKILDESKGKSGYKAALESVLKQHKWTATLAFLTQGAVMATLYVVYNVLWCIAAWHLVFKKRYYANQEEYDRQIDAVLR